MFISNDDIVKLEGSDRMFYAIYDRISVRTYEKKPLKSDERIVIDQLINEVKPTKGPFLHTANFFIDHQDKNLDDEAKRIGTYGFIKNAPSFIIGTIPNVREAIIDYGYIFEHLILKLTQSGYGTCWLAGTFDRKAFDSLIKNDLIIPAITPVGFAEDSMSLRERAIRVAIKANRRKSFEEMFFVNDTNHPMKNDKNHPLYYPLEAVQLAPSASNKQPWKIIIEPNRIHLYLEPTPNYATNRPFNIQYLDMGIALCHFEVALNHHNIKHTIKTMEHPYKKDFEYIISIELNT